MKKFRRKKIGGKEKAAANLSSRVSPPEERKGEPSYGFLLFTVLLIGCGILMLEVLGARIIGPLFGMNLYVWTALISVTLLSLSVGYWLGGIVSDRWPRADTMYGLILVSAVFVGLIAWLDRPVLSACYRIFTGVWSIRFGMLAGALVLFAPPLTLLGMVSPYVIKIGLNDLQKTGKTVGKLYAVSTAGSVFGSILTGYVLIPGIGISKTLLVVTVVILIPPIIWFVSRRLFRLAILGVLIFVLSILTGLEMPQEFIGSGLRIVDKKDGLYGQIKVIDQTLDSGDKRWIMTNGIVQTGIFIENKQCVSPYAYLMVYFLRFFPPAGEEALLIGLGGGSQVGLLKDQGFNVDVVEIDPTMVDFATKYFAFDPDGCRVILEDGRMYIRRSKKKYDVVLFDVFSSGGQPYHLFSRETFEDVGRILKPGGIVVLNVAGYREGKGAMMMASTLRTVSSVFSEYRLCFTSLQGKPDELDNVLFFFSDSPFVDPDVASMSEENLLHWQSISARWMDIDASKGRVITDDWNPIDLWTVMINEDWRQNEFKFFGPEVIFQ